MSIQYVKVIMNFRPSVNVIPREFINLILISS